MLKPRLLFLSHFIHITRLLSSFGVRFPLLETNETIEANFSLIIQNFLFFFLRARHIKARIDFFLCFFFLLLFLFLFWQMYVCMYYNENFSYWHSYAPSSSVSCTMSQTTIAITGKNINNTKERGRSLKKKTSKVILPFDLFPCDAAILCHIWHTLT